MRLARFTFPIIHGPSYYVVHSCIWVARNYKIYNELPRTWMSAASS